MAPWSGRRWSSKQYILAALLGTLVAIAAAAAISITLAPGHVSFSVQDARLNKNTVNKKAGLYNLFYNFTVVANNTSKRMAVQYGYLSAKIWYSEWSWIPADDANTSSAMSGSWQPPLGTPAVVKVSADWAQSSVKDNETGSSEMTNNIQSGSDMSNIRSAYCLVYLEVKVRFRFGLVPTMPYTVRAFCFPVNFRDGDNSTIQCTPSQGQNYTAGVPFIPLSFGGGTP